MRKILLFLLVSVIGFTALQAAGPDITCVPGLPGCNEIKTPQLDTGYTRESTSAFIGKLISQVIQYTAIVAVIALMISGMMYMLSGGEEEKTKRAKTWIIWSLVGVFLSISASGIIQLLNTFTLGSKGDTVDGVLSFAKDSLFQVLAVVGIGVFLYVGIRLGVARGNPEEFKKALMMAIYAIIGLFIVAVSWAVVNLVSGLTI